MNGAINREENMTTISEPELILPVLHILASRGQQTTSELIHLLRNLLHPTGEDLVILQGRNDDKFSQKVRNLKAHNTHCCMTCIR